MSQEQGEPRVDVLWKQYSLQVDLYKFYFEIAVKVTAFYYAVTGAILAFLFQHPGDGLIRYSLLLPLAFSFGIGGIFFYGAHLLGVIRSELFRIRDQLALDTAPEMMVLVVMLRIFGIILIMTGIALGLLLDHTAQPALAAVGV